MSGQGDAHSSSERDRVAGKQKIHLFQSQETRREKQKFLSPSVKDLHYARLRRRSSQLTIYGQSRWMGFFFFFFFYFSISSTPLRRNAHKFINLSNPQTSSSSVFFLFLKDENFPSIKRPNKLTTAASAPVLSSSCHIISLKKSTPVDCLSGPQLLPAVALRALATFTR